MKFIPASIIPIKWNDHPQFIGEPSKNPPKKGELPSLKVESFPKLIGILKIKLLPINGNYLFLPKSFLETL
jgi:hypothetical protein